MLSILRRREPSQPSANRTSQTCGPTGRSASTQRRCLASDNELTHEDVRRATFLAVAPLQCILKKFLWQQMDPTRCPDLTLAG